MGNKIREHWLCIGHKILPLKSDIWLVAFLFDPCYMLNEIECDEILGIDWIESVHRLFC
jgi:hypothetical protein